MYQVVVMAGGSGSRMYPLTEGIPKALLPVANKPLIWYSLKMLENVGFQDVIVVVQQSYYQKVALTLAEHSDSLEMLTLDIVSIDGDMGTADALRAIKDKIRTDFIVTSCDLVADIPIHLVIDLHRHTDAAMTMLVAEPLPTDSPVPEKGKKSADEGLKDFIGLDDTQKRLLYFSAEADVEDDFTVSKSLLLRYPRINVTNKLLDAHFYVFKKWIVDFLAEKKYISAIKGDLVPYLVRKQFSKRRHASPDKGPNIYSFAAVNEADLTAYSMSSTPIQLDDTIKCQVYQMKGKFCARVNTLASYIEINRQPPKDLFTSGKPDALISPSLITGERSQIGSDSMVREGVVVGDQTSIKKTILGKHCKIGSKVRLANCVLMDYVTVDDECDLRSVIICTNAFIQKNCNLDNCRVGFGHTVPAGTKVKNEDLTADSGFE